jgi:hypothetical protein
MHHLLLPLFCVGATGTQPAIGIPIEFIIFGLLLVGVAVFHHRTFEVAVAGLAILLAYKLGFTGFDLPHHLHEEWRLLLNLFGLLMGFAILARHFEQSRIPDVLPHWLPNGWQGGFVLLAIVFGLAIFIDNIAAAMLGGAIALSVFQRRIHIGFLAAIAAAANAGGAFSVIGSTPTSMMWIDGVAARDVLPAALGSATGLLVFGIAASWQQQRYQPISRDANPRTPIDWGRVAIVVLIPALAVTTNVTMGMMALGVWVAILIGSAFRKTDWSELRRSLKGSLFLVALVLSASLMPVDKLPPATWHSTLLIGVLSAVFDNIPLTKLALDQGGYDWAFAAYAISCGGSMVWFGSSAGVALCNMFQEARDVVQWTRQGWHVVAGYFAGFFVMLLVLGWHPHARHKPIGGAHELQISPPAAEKMIEEKLAH